MNKVILTGNGLSVGLNQAFSLQNITQTFYENLPAHHKKFVEHHMERIQKGQYIQVDFEEAIASIEQVHDSLDGYVKFLESEDEGRNFLKTENLKVEELQEHLSKIKEIILSYTASIVEIIDGNVRREQIDKKLSGFSRWLQKQYDEGSDIDLFTLNFDLLIETILLGIVGTDQFTDFHVRRGYWEGAEKFNFSPQENIMDFGRRKIRLHHLHGSLSSFKRLSDGRIFKLKTEDIRLHDFYKNLNTKECFPSIITGGYKSSKVQISPFNFYYNEFKVKMFDIENTCDELYIIGYSFRDEHINEAIKARLALARKRGEKKKILKKLVIVDFKTTMVERNKFVSDVNYALDLKSPRTQLSIEKGNFLFDGADSIERLNEE